MKRAPLIPRYLRSSQQISRFMKLRGPKEDSARRPHANGRAGLRRRTVEAHGRPHVSRDRSGRRHGREPAPAGQGSCLSSFRLLGFLFHIIELIYDRLEPVRHHSPSTGTATGLAASGHEECR
jgi:hypothetical protein